MPDQSRSAASAPPAPATAARRERRRRIKPETYHPLDVLFEPLFAVHGAQRRLLSAEELILRRTFGQALAGKPAAVRAMLKVHAANQQARAARQAARQMTYGDPMPRGWQALVVLRIALPDVAAGTLSAHSLKVAPWVAEMAELRSGSNPHSRAVYGPWYVRDETMLPHGEGAEWDNRLGEWLQLRTPEQTRFATGVSGNPKGRPAQADQQEPSCQGFFEETLTVRVNGRLREMTGSSCSSTA